MPSKKCRYILFNVYINAVSYQNSVCMEYTSAYLSLPRIMHRYQSSPRNNRFYFYVKLCREWNRDLVIRLHGVWYLGTFFRLSPPFYTAEERKADHFKNRKYF